ncbi:Concanavalin A-like lectin/glucanases superfamily protein [Paenibacillus sp. ov031]|uniref:LamG-like jellyroll fold domain-containing protein n=1 Tax=Paenibacillus sp. ov031 TaxID=1761879 RepID=UPI00091E4432|nr:LamG-like jellyroll fold domain-containing protein [Paenibacillus sp. ov031]SHN71816.1 Concanavalin A-like lectin/glucanases superfamily protein [Paenibacillus sp. ov031]
MVNYNALYTKYLMDKYGVSWFKFDETVTSTVLDSKGTNTSTVTGTSIVSGVSGNARSFDGAGLIQLNSRVIPLGRKSIRFKFKRNGNPLSDEYIISNELGSSGNHGDRISVTGNTGLITWVSCKGTSGVFRLAFSSPNSVCDNQWHDILLTWDGTTNTNTAKIYVDDMKNPVATSTATAIETTAQSTNLVIGASSLSNARLYFTGLIDELEIYNEVVVPIMSKILLSYGDKVVSVKQGSPQENLVPAMTNYTIPSGTVEASTTYSSYYAWKAFDRVNDSYGWLSNAITGWLKYTFPLAILVQAYTIKSGDNSTTRTPKTWTFEGSNDGTNWTVLDTRTNETNWSTGERRSYVFKNKTKFLSYRINVTSNNGDTSYVSIGEMEMMELGASTLKLLTNSDESTFLKEGIDIGNLSEIADKIKLYRSNSSTLASGKTFEHTIDMSKRRVDKITLG